MTRTKEGPDLPGFTLCCESQTCSHSGGEAKLAKERNKISDFEKKKPENDKIFLLANGKKGSSCLLVLVCSLPHHLTLTTDLISRWPNLEIKPSDQGKPLARVTFFSVTLSSKCPGHLLQGSRCVE